MLDTGQLNLETLLASIPGDSPSGWSLSASDTYDQIKEYRKTVEPIGILGRLREGEAKTADWKNVSALCCGVLTTRSKDLPVAVYLAESMAKQRGLLGVSEGLRLIQGLLERFWPNLYPPIATGLDDRAVWLERFDLFVAQSVAETIITERHEGQAYNLMEWEFCQSRTHKAIRLPQNTTKEKTTRDAALANVKERQEQLDNAIAITSSSFYNELAERIRDCVQLCEQVKGSIREAFNQEVGLHQMEEVVPDLARVKERLRQCEIRVEDILKSRPAPPEAQVPPEVPSQAHAEERPFGSGPQAEFSRATFALEPQSREDAILRLTAIGNYFQKAEPFSPVSYVVQRAVRWSTMSLEKWLTEMVPDVAVLGKIKENLGLPGKEK